jgi:hypothetical protein
MHVQLQETRHEKEKEKNISKRNNNLPPHPLHFYVASTKVLRALAMTLFHR